MVQPHHIGFHRLRPAGKDVVKIRPVHLAVRRAVQLLVIGGKVKTADFLARIEGAEDIGPRINRNPANLLAQAEIDERMHGVGTHLDAGADLAKLGRLFVNLDVVSGLHQAGRGGQPAHPGPGDKYF